MRERQRRLENHYKPHRSRGDVCKRVHTALQGSFADEAGKCSAGGVQGNTPQLFLGGTQARRRGRGSKRFAILSH